jgi:crotonobetainyl-CoA:carnitine CoA-transferase CaiB-like acyl-CoA transferase
MLSPYRVLDLTDERGQLCGQMLADLGADVVVAEPPVGSPSRRLGPFENDERDPERSLFWAAYNRNKRGITLDLESEEGREKLRRLVQTTDFLLESYEPGYLDGLGIGYEALRAINSRLVMVSITPFGQTGPKANWAAADLTAYAASGVHALVGDEDRPPVKVAEWQAWLYAAAEGAVGALVAHAARERDGVGQHVDVSAQTATAAGTQSFILQHGWGDNPVHRVAGGVAFGPIKVQLIYPCKDGYVTAIFLFGSGLGPFTRKMMEVIHEEGFIDEATRDKDWINYTVLLLSGEEPISEMTRCAAAIEAWTKSHTKAELFQLSLERGLLIVPVSTTEDLVHSEQLAARGFWTPVARADGSSITVPGPFARFSATPIRYHRPAPRLGEHTEEVLGEWRTRTRDRAVAGAAADGAEGRNGRRGPLDGVKVLDFTWVVVGPASVRYLTDAGATVIKVESTTRVDTARTLQPFKDAQPGPERSGLFANVNAGKLGLTLNMSTLEARAVAQRLACWADVVVENFTPKAMRAWGMAYEDLRTVNPGIILVSTSLNGQTGPQAFLAGFGTMGAAAGGFAEQHGWPDRIPAGAGAWTDYVAPKFIAASILAALDHRRRTGEGQFIDLSQTEASVQFLAPAILDYTVNGRVRSRIGNASIDFAPHGVYPVAGDDRWVAIAATSEAQWQALCEASDNAGWRDDPRFLTNDLRLEHAEALDALIGAWTAGQEAGAVEETLQRARVPVHRVNTSEDCFADPQLGFREHLFTVEHPELGPVPVESSRMRFSGTPAQVARPGPTFGQDNEYVLRELLGMTDEEVVELTIAGALE